MSKYSYDRYTETDFLIPYDIEEVTNIQAKKGFVHKCKAKKLYLNNWPLYKGIWKFHEIMPMLPNRKISIGFSCNIQGVRKESGVEISCTYSRGGNPSEVGELDPESDYSVSVSL